VEEGSAIGVGSATGVGGLRAGIVGTGFIGRVHARSVRVAGARVVGVAASSPERASVAAQEIGADTAFASAEALIGSDEIDVVHICTPNHLHVPLGLAALEAGKHIVCEKPVALDSAGAAELLAAADAAGRVATVPFVYRYYPTVREARARIRSTDAGALRLVHGGYLQDWLLAADDDNWRVDAELGGPSRAFADTGSHWCDLTEFVTGERIRALTARTAIAHPRRQRSSRPSFGRGSSEGESRAVETEDIATVLFETDRDTSGSVVISQVSAGHKNRLWFEVSSNTETISFNQELPDSLSVRNRGAAERIPRDFDTLSAEAADYVTLPGGHPQGYHDCFDAFTTETYATIAGALPDEGLPRLADGLRAAWITEAVLESSRLRSWVEVRDG
jgi:predicted dehydrogenase